MSGHDFIVPEIKSERYVTQAAKPSAYKPDGYTGYSGTWAKRQLQKNLLDLGIILLGEVDESILGLHERTEVIRRIVHDDDAGFAGRQQNLLTDKVRRSAG